MGGQPTPQVRAALLGRKVRDGLGLLVRGLAGGKLSGERIEPLAGDEELVQFLPRQRHNPDDLVGTERDQVLGLQPPEGFSQRRDRQPQVGREPLLVDRRTGRERAREDPLPELLIGRFGFSQDADSMQLGLGRLGHSLSHRR